MILQEKEPQQYSSSRKHMGLAEINGTIKCLIKHSPAVQESIWWQTSYKPT